MNNKKIVISKNGPYLVSGNIPLEEMIIEQTVNGNVYKQGKKFPNKEEYALCRCGRSKNMPFCDGTHQMVRFDGTLTASKEPYVNQAKRYYGKDIVLEDVEKLCAYARFCHSRDSEVWTLTEESVDQNKEDLAIKLTSDCPSGRLVMRDRESNQAIEPAFEPSIVLLQDPFKQCSGPIWVRGGIPIEDEKGIVYEKRNRVTLCRCGGSRNKPFCDANHVNIKFRDNLYHFE